jgi:hypothetical protein
MNFEIKIQVDPNWRRLEDFVKDEVERAARHIEGDAIQRVNDWPAVKRGFMVGSIDAHKHDMEGMEWEIGPTMEYSPFVEYGTANADGSERMAARPFMVPAAEQERPRFFRAVQEIFRKF